MNTISEINYKQIVENASSAIFKTDIKGNIVYVNPHASSLFGYEVDELTQKNIIDILFSVHKYNVKDTKNIINKVIECPEKNYKSINQNIKISKEITDTNWSFKRFFR